MVDIINTSTLRYYGININKDIEQGVVVLEVSSNSGAESAGIKKGDVITKINGNETKDSAYLRYELYQHQAGDTIEITYIRNNKEYTANVKLGSN